MLTLQRNASSSLHLKRRPLLNFAAGLLCNRLAIRVSQLLAFLSLLVACVGFVLPEILGVFSDIVEKLIVDRSQLWVCCIGCRVGGSLCGRFRRHAECRKHQRLHDANDRVANILDQDGEKEEEDENLGSGEQGNRSVIASEEGVAVAPAASRS